MTEITQLNYGSASKDRCETDDGEESVSPLTAEQRSPAISEASTRIIMEAQCPLGQYRSLPNESIGFGSGAARSDQI
jgi:hypothetical protein